MKNSLCLGVLAVTCLGLGTANAQPPAMLPPVGTTPSAPMPSVPFAAPAAQGMPASQPGISEYLAYPRPTGSTGVGGDGGIGGEVYLRSGISINLGGTGIFGRIYEPGFEVQGGIRSVFFRPDPTVGWTVDVGLSTTWYHNRRDETAVLRNFPSSTGSTAFGTSTTTIIPNFPVTPSNLNQTSVRVALGQEYYFSGDADPADGDIKWRAGWDAGGTLGTQKLDLDEIRHRTGMTYGGLIALHSDVEMPYGQCILQAGFRAEYRYTGSNILESQNNTDLSTLGLMFSTGVRY